MTRIKTPTIVGGMPKVSPELREKLKREANRVFSDGRAMHKRRLDVLKSYYGGITGVWHAFQDAGYVEMSRKAVEKWFERGRLPDDKFKVMVMVITQGNKTDEFFEHVAKMGITPEDLFK